MNLKSNWSTWAEACARDDKLKESKPAWDAVSSRPATDPERQKLLQRLVRYAFTDDRDLLGTRDNCRFGYWLSFCGATERGFWMDTDESPYHCCVCGEYKDRYEWHCKVCNKCWRVLGWFVGVVEVARCIHYHACFGR
jgi:hypothetical protein